MRQLREHLEKNDSVSPEIISEATKLSQKTGRGLGATLLDMGVFSDEQLYSIYATLSGLQVWNGRGEVSDVSNLSQDFLLFNRVLPVHSEDKLTVVIAHPEDDGLVDMLQRLLPQAEIAIAPEREIQFRLENHFHIDGESSTSDSYISDIEHLKDLALEAPIIRYVNDMILSGIKVGASDIHMEPMRNKIELRYRVDGVLHARPAPTVEEYPAIVSRIKILSQLDIAERRLPQDGRFSVKTGGKDVDVRVSTIPTNFGEDVALRLLDQKKQLLSLGALGVSPRMVTQFREVLNKSHGLILVTGPTGSGKTTTLYSGLRDIVDGHKKIITVEDPVEYDIPGISQIPVNAEIGVTFANTLRSILRHDPDVILVGEIRDRETAEIAVQAALTGHLVLSTVHTNSAVGAIGRLLNMGVADYLLASSLIAVTGQRLVRKLCPHCRSPGVVSEVHVKKYGFAPGARIYNAKGCPECGQIGYKGRLPISEFLGINASVRSSILSEPTPENISNAAGSDYITMLQDGFSRVLAGESTIEEILRVVG
ncbi:MAG: type II/IV secretion system protein [Alphaproteobacteria bacterium]|nr:MAG: type II/IV secretion system protein [Alphaproteobacteria bacterium]